MSAPGSLNQMLWLSIEVSYRLVLVAAIAANTTLEVVVLASAADPATIREVKVVLLFEV